MERMHYTPDDLNDVLKDIPTALAKAKAGDTKASASLLWALSVLKWPPHARNHLSILQPFLMGALVGSNPSRLPEPHPEQTMVWSFYASCILIESINSAVENAEAVTNAEQTFHVSALRNLPRAFDCWWTLISQDPHHNGILSEEASWKDIILDGLHRIVEFLAVICSTEPYCRNIKLPEISLRGCMLAGDVDEAVSWYQIFSSLTPLSESLPEKYMRPLVEDFGASRVADRLVRLFLEAKDDTRLMGPMTSLLSSIAFSPFTPITESIGRSDFLITLMPVLWVNIKVLAVPTSDERHTQLFIILLQVLRVLFVDVAPLRHLRALLDCDLVPFITQTLCYSVRYLKDSVHLSRAIEMACSSVLAVLVGAMEKPIAPLDLPWSEYFRPFFLSTLFALTSEWPSSGATKMVECINQWTKLGRGCGLSVPRSIPIHSADVEHARVVSKVSFRKAFFGGGPVQHLDGCSWDKCVFFGAKTKRIMLRCFGCGRAQYCAIDPCQKRAWTTGGHKESCKRQQMLLRT